MPILSHSELKYLLIDSFRLYTEDVAYVAGNNPYQLKINQKNFYIFIHNVHDSGHGRVNDDESRIQIQRNRNFEAAQTSGLPILFLGFYAELHVFTAWEPQALKERINRRGVVSVYSRFSVQRRASEQGIAVYQDSRGQVIITFKPEFLGLYLENFAKMHNSNEETLLRLAKVSSETSQTVEGEEEGVTIGRSRFVVTHTSFKRDPRFRQVVYDSYSERCAFCGIQLELIDAAHIVPHSHEQGNDDLTNGISLCSLHHAAFDNGLVFIDEDYNIKINEDKVEYLVKVGKDGGLRKFEGLHFDKIQLPRSRVDYPSVEYIKLANHIRGINR